MTDLTGRTALVTGAGKGIGRNIAECLAAAGATVAVNYGHDEEAAERVVKTITDAGGVARAFQADVSQEDDTVRMFEQVRAAFAPVDLLVNNAGVWRFAPIEEATPAEFHRHFDTNVLGNVLATREFARQSEANGGAIVNISSVGVAFTQPQTALYTGTKAALVAMTRVLAVELAPRQIRVNAIAAGLIDTEGTQASGFIGSDAEKQVVAQIPLGRLGQPDDIGPVAVFLASDAAKFITGDVLFASGGQV